MMKYFILIFIFNLQSCKHVSYYQDYENDIDVFFQVARRQIYDKKKFKHFVLEDGFNNRNLKVICINKGKNRIVFSGVVVDTLKYPKPSFNFSSSVELLIFKIDDKKIRIDVKENYRVLKMFLLKDSLKVIYSNNFHSNE